MSCDKAVLCEMYFLMLQLIVYLGQICNLFVRCWLLLENITRDLPFRYEDVTYHRIHTTWMHERSNYQPFHRIDIWASNITILALYIYIYDGILNRIIRVSEIVCSSCSSSTHAVHMGPTARLYWTHSRTWDMASLLFLSV